MPSILTAPAYPKASPTKARRNGHTKPAGLPAPLGERFSDTPAPVEVMDVPGESLTSEERRELREHEEAIGRGALAWLEMGNALWNIRDKRLHREQFETFEDYCRERFHIERSTAYQLINAAKRYELALPIASRLQITFTAESQLRPLTRCQAVDLPDVLKLAAKQVEPDGEGNRVPTAKILAEAVNQVRQRKNPNAAADKRSSGATTSRAKSDQEARTAARTLQAIPVWSDEDLLTISRAIARELVKRGIISPFANGKS